MAKTRRAIVLDQPGVVKVMDVPLPRIRPIYALVKTTAIGIHPIDPPSIDYYGANGSIPGCEFTGIVEEVGSEVEQDIKPGDRVLGFVHGCKTDSMDVVTELFKGAESMHALCQESGAFTDHVLAHGDILMKIPPDMPDTEAVAFGVAITAVGMAFYQHLNLRWPHDPYTRPVPIFINGGATATGAMAIQVAKLCGMKVVTTCSPTNSDYVKSLGADAWYDYNEEGWQRKVRRDFPMIEYAYDTCMNFNGWPGATEVFSLSGGQGVVNQIPDASVFTRQDIKYYQLATYGAFGQRFSLGPIECPDLPENYEFTKKWWVYASKLLWEGKLKPHRTIVRDGGLEGALQGLDDMRHQKIRGYKLVYRMNEPES